MIHEAYMPVYRCPDFHCGRVYWFTRGSTRGPRGPKNIFTPASKPNFISRALKEIGVAETVTGFRRFREFRPAVLTILAEDVLRDSQDGQVSGIRSFGEKNSLIICPFLGVLIP